MSFIESVIHKLVIQLLYVVQRAWDTYRPEQLVRPLGFFYIILQLYIFPYSLLFSFPFFSPILFLPFPCCSRECTHYLYLVLFPYCSWEHMLTHLLVFFPYCSWEHVHASSCVVPILLLGTCSRIFLCCSHTTLEHTSPISSCGSELNLFLKYVITKKSLLY